MTLGLGEVLEAYDIYNACNDLLNKERTTPPVLSEVMASGLNFPEAVGEDEWRRCTCLLVIERPP